MVCIGAKKPGVAGVGVGRDRAVGRGFTLRMANALGGMKLDACRRRRERSIRLLQGVRV